MRDYVKLCFLSGSGFSAGFVSTSKSRYLQINNLNRNSRMYRNYIKYKFGHRVGDPDVFGPPGSGSIS